jgi:hypothetical protein
MGQKLMVIGFNFLVSLVIYSLLMVVVFYFFHYEANVLIGLLLGFVLGLISIIILSWRVFKQINDSHAGKFIYAFLTFLLAIPVYIYILFWLAFIF